MNKSSTYRYQLNAVLQKFFHVCLALMSASYRNKLGFNIFFKMCVKSSDSESTEIIFLISYKLLYIIYEISKSLEFAHPYLKGGKKERFMLIGTYN